MPGIAPHDFQDHDTVMRRGCRLQPIQCLDRNIDRRGKADRIFRQSQIVIDGFGNPHQIDATHFGQPMQDRHTAIPANPDQGIKAKLAIPGNHFGRTVGKTAIGHRIMERITLIHGAKNRTTQTQHSVIIDVIVQINRLRRVLHQTVCSLPDANHVPAITKYRTAHNRQNNRIQARTIATTGQNSDPHPYPPSCQILFTRQITNHMGCQPEF